MKSVVLTIEQCRGARAMLGWSQDELAQAANVSRQTIADYERGARSPISNNLIAIRKAFEAAGLVFIAENGGGAGLRFEKPSGSEEN
ncbi:helix-turn-helix domain-containing protein [Oryzicola mucosus]